MPELDLFRLSNDTKKYALLGQELGSDGKDFLMDIGDVASKSFKFMISDIGDGSKKLYEYMKSKATTKNIIATGSIVAIGIPIFRFFR